MKNDMYFFHQTPKSVAKEIIDSIDWKDGEVVFEPFKGEGAFYDQLPNNVTKFYSEIEEDLCFKDFDYENTHIDTIITNPPFRLENDNGDRKNAFYKILEFFSTKNVDRIIFLCNDYCFGTLTPKRLQKLNDNKLYLNELTTINIKKWRGRYYKLVFKRTPNLSFNYFLTNFD